MAGKLDQIIVVDLEATCWQGSPPAGQESEIIEIGVCLLDVTSGQRSKKQAILIRPERSTVSPFCTKLTTLTQEMAAGGISFAEACDRLQREYTSSDRTWASYGDYDRRKMEQQCRDFGVRFPFNKSHLNVKNLLSLFLNLPFEVGLDQAMERLGMPLEGTHHRGIDDAWNIAAILGHLMMQYRGQER